MNIEKYENLHCWLQQDQKLDTTNSSAQSCNEDASKIFGEGHWYWIHDFVATFKVNNRPINTRPSVANQLGVGCLILDPGLV